MSAGRPLEGRRLVVTRRPEQAAALVQKLEELGATVILAPTVDVVAPPDTTELDAALGRLESFDWVVLTSANACHFLRLRMDALGVAASTLGPPVRIASVGPATTRAFREQFSAGAVDLEPDREFRAEGLLRALVDRGVAGRRVLVPCSDRARDTLPRGLAEAGAQVTRVVAYATVPSGAPDALVAELERGVDLVLFASPSAVEGFLSMTAGREAIRAAVIGPVTEDAARSAGLEVAVVASPSTAEGLVAGIVAHLPRKP